jgi:protein associated with RNAse G/E
MQNRIGHIFDKHFWNNILLMISAAGLMFIVTYVMVRLVPLRVEDNTFLIVTLKLALITSVSAVAYLSISHLFDISESRPVIKKIKYALKGNFSGLSRTKR